MSTRRKHPRGNPARRVRAGVLHGESMHLPKARAGFGILAAPEPGRHLWVVDVLHVVSDESAAIAHAGGRVDLDTETVAMVATGCFVCQQPYGLALAAEPCAGNPRNRPESPGEL